MISTLQNVHFGERARRGRFSVRLAPKMSVWEALNGTLISPLNVSREARLTAPGTPSLKLRRTGAGALPFQLGCFESRGADAPRSGAPSNFLFFKRFPITLLRSDFT